MILGCQRVLLPCDRSHLAALTLTETGPTGCSDGNAGVYHDVSGCHTLNVTFSQQSPPRIGVRSVGGVDYRRN